jgi:hypothetical protein
MTFEFWATAGLFVAAVLFLMIDVPAARPRRNNLTSKLSAFDAGNVFFRGSEGNRHQKWIARASQVESEGNRP